MGFRQAVQKKKVEVYKTPSLYGSHKSMEIGSEEMSQETLDLLAEAGDIALRDEKGVYITKVNRLDTGLADPKRYGERVAGEKN